MARIRIRRHRDPEPGQSRTVRFEGRDFGAPVSMFLTDNPPGTGSALHVHPYAETWVVRAGEGAFTVGDEEIRASAGDIVVAPPDVPHRFVNVGEGPLRMVCIHPRAAMEQVNL